MDFSERSVECCVCEFLACFQFVALSKTATRVVMGHPCGMFCYYEIKFLCAMIVPADATVPVSIATTRACEFSIASIM